MNNNEEFESDNTPQHNIMDGELLLFFVFLFFIYFYIIIIIVYFKDVLLNLLQ